ncbi:hypothetical protein GGR56DRAFT_679081 [Xylariaceae sp. FL0804]|nr:hypothetical protein GGR56DRAFT_679081 [Xylariaceae sp. FL0804]
MPPRTPSTALPPDHPLGPAPAEKTLQAVRRLHQVWGVWPWDLFASNNPEHWSVHLAESLRTLAVLTTLDHAKTLLAKRLDADTVLSPALVHDAVAERKEDRGAPVNPRVKRGRKRTKHTKSGSAPRSSVLHDENQHEDEDEDEDNDEDEASGASQEPAYNDLSDLSDLSDPDYNPDPNPDFDPEFDPDFDPSSRHRSAPAQAHPRFDLGADDTIRVRLAPTPSPSSQLGASVPVPKASSAAPYYAPNYTPPNKRRKVLPRSLLDRVSRRSSLSLSLSLPTMSTALNPAASPATSLQGRTRTQTRTQTQMDTPPPSATTSFATATAETMHEVTDLTDVDNVASAVFNLMNRCAGALDTKDTDLRAVLSKAEEEVKTWDRELASKKQELEQVIVESATIREKLEAKQMDKAQLDKDFESQQKLWTQIRDIDQKYGGLRQTINGESQPEQQELQSSRVAVALQQVEEQVQDLLDQEATLQTRQHRLEGDVSAVTKRHAEAVLKISTSSEAVDQNSGVAESWASIKKQFHGLLLLHGLADPA